MDRTQNEDIVQALLNEEPSARLLPAFPPSLFRRLSEDPAADEPLDVAASGNVMGPTAAVHEVLDHPSLEALLEHLDTLSEEQIASLSEEVCRAVATQPIPVFQEGSLLPQTVTVGFRGGMSGHFIAKITKTTEAT